MSTSTRRPRWQLGLAGCFISVIFIHFTVTPLHSLMKTAASPSARECDPYSQPGFLEFSPHDPHGNRWMTFSPGCSSPALFASFARAAWKTIPPSNPSSLDSLIPSNWVDAEHGPDHEKWDEMEWARGRTVVVMGDSVLRYAIIYFCEMMGETLTGIHWKHPFSPSAPEDVGDLNLEEAFSPRPDPAPGMGMPVEEPSDQPTGHSANFCYIPGLDFLLIQNFNYGLDQDGFWKFKEKTIPYLIENRLNITSEYTRRAQIAAGRGAPDLVYLNSALWDAARFMKEDVDAEISHNGELRPDRLSWYHDRVQDVVLKAREVFPSTSLKWVTSTFPIGDMNGWFTEGKRTKNSLIRLTELSNAAIAALDTPLVQKAKVGICRWGQLLMGEEIHQIDDLHPTLLPGGYLFADMMLWDLKQAVTRTQLSFLPNKC